MNHTSLTKKGFTLIELIIVSGVLVILLGVLINVFITILEAKADAEAASAVVVDGGYIMSRLSYDIAQASNITTPASAGASGSTLTLIISGTSYSYALSGANLQLTSSGNTDNLNGYATNISNLTFTRLGNTGGKNTIRVSFRVTSTTTDNNTEYQDFQMTAGTR